MNKMVERIENLLSTSEKGLSFRQTTIRLCEERLASETNIYFVIGHKELNIESTNSDEGEGQSITYTSVLNWKLIYRYRKDESLYR